MPPLQIVALSLLLVPLGQAEETPAHLGPITGIVIGGNHIYSVSQAGVFREAKRLAKPQFRVMSMASAPKKMPSRYCCSAAANQRQAARSPQSIPP